VKKKTSTVPAFLVYAGIIHAIGLALLMPMLITLPGPGSEVAPQTSAIDVEIVSGTSSTADSEQTSALPASEAEVDAPSAGEAVANVSPEAEPQDETEPSPQQAPSVGSPAEEGAKVAAPAEVAPRAPKKPVVQRTRTKKPVIRHTAKTQKTKIAPFNGALSGLFSPGAPSNIRRR
jgi:hypothetical protein